MKGFAVCEYKLFPNHALNQYNLILIILLRMGKSLEGISPIYINVFNVEFKMLCKLLVINMLKALHKNAIWNDNSLIFGVR